MALDDCPILNATVFKSCAEICRTVDVQLMPGVNNIKISSFVGIDKNSIK